MQNRNTLRFRGFTGGSLIKNLPANAGDVGLILGQDDPLEEEMATHSSILAWRIPWTRDPGRLQSMGSQRVGHDLATTQIWMVATIENLLLPYAKKNVPVSPLWSDLQPFIKGQNFKMHLSWEVSMTCRGTKG